MSGSVVLKPSARVVGAGLSGLATAYYLEKAGYTVEVYERNDREGGLIRTRVTAYGLVELAANAFLNSTRVEALFEDLGLELLAANSTARRRYIFRTGKLRRWPLGWAASWNVVRFGLRMLFFRNSVRPRPRETISQWGTRAFGREATESLLLPALQGIYAGDGTRMSARLILDPLFIRRSSARPRVRGSVSAREGMGSVLAALRRRLEERGVAFHFNSNYRVEASPKILTIVCGSARDAADAVVTADSELSACLREVEMLPVATTTVFFESESGLKAGFGALFPRDEGFFHLGVLNNRAIFEGRGSYHSETWIAGGADSHTASGKEAWSEELLRAQVLKDRERLARGGVEPVATFTQIWPVGLPHYTTDLEMLLPRITQRLRAPENRNLRLMGNYLGGLGVSKILDAAAELAEYERRGGVDGE